MLALGMNAAPFNLVKRNLVRTSMLRHKAVLEGRIVFRFVIGRMLVAKVPRPRSNDAHPDVSLEAKKSALQGEIATYGDVVQLDAIDGPGVAMECPAAEKNIVWLQYALRTFPKASYYGKTEDDTFVNLDMLELELLRLSALRVSNVVYGLFGICSMPTAKRAERSANGFKACFL